VHSVTSWPSTPRSFRCERACVFHGANTSFHNTSSRIQQWSYIQTIVFTIFIIQRHTL